MQNTKKPLKTKQPIPKMYGARAKLKMVILNAFLHGLFTEHISFIHVAFLR